MKLKNLPPFKVGDVIEYDIPCAVTKYVVVSVDVSGVTGRWSVTCRWAGLFGRLTYRLGNHTHWGPAEYFRRVK